MKFIILSLCIAAVSCDIVLPGTKWCGAGNVAENYYDLGTEWEADICCRNHDHCPETIPAGQSRHNLHNDIFYTRLSCACDEALHRCLKDAKTEVAETIGHIYFNLLPTQCYREDYPVLGCRRSGGWLSEIGIDTKCIEYAYYTYGEKTYQWFDVQEF